jgi:hypothetical protein
VNNKTVKREQPLCLEFQYIQMYQTGFSSHRRIGCWLSYKTGAVSRVTDNKSFWDSTMAH